MKNIVLSLKDFIVLHDTANLTTFNTNIYSYNKRKYPKNAENLALHLVFNFKATV